MVSHLRGRQLNPSKIEIYRADVSHRLQRLQECSVGTVGLIYSIALCIQCVCACVSHVCLWGCIVFSSSLCAFLCVNNCFCITF